MNENGKTNKSGEGIELHLMKIAVGKIFIRFTGG